MRASKGIGIASSLALLLLTAAAATPAFAEKASSIRREITKVEKEFFALYNKLNTQRQFDMICRMETTTGSNFARRVCEPRYLERAKQASATERIQAANRSGTPPGAGADVGAPMMGSAPVVDSQQEAFRKNMLEVLERSAELAALGRKRDELQHRLDAVTK